MTAPVGFSVVPLLPQLLCARSVVHRCRGLLLAFSLIITAAFCLESRAVPQNIPDVPPPTCDTSIPGNCDRVQSRDPAEEQRRQQELARWRAQRKAEKERKKREKQEKKRKKEEEGRRSAEEARKQEEEARQRAERLRQEQLEAERQAAVRLQREREAKAEAARSQAIFDQRKPEILAAFKNPGGNEPAVDLRSRLKSPDAPPSAWDMNITDATVIPIAKRLNRVVPPPPISKEQVNLSWKDIYLAEDRLANTTDLVIAGWEMTGTLSGSLCSPYKIVLIAGKAVIAGEDGAYLHLVKDEENYNAALRFLKNPEQRQTFARLVQDIRENRPVPAPANADMVKAARAITDPKLGNSAESIAFDAMLSKEAVSAMFRKALVEVASQKLSDKFGEVTKDLMNRKAVFDAVRLERQQAMRALAQTTDPERAAQLKTVIEQANRKSAATYWMDKGAYTVTGFPIGDGTDKISECVFGLLLNTPEGRPPCKEGK